MAPRRDDDHEPVTLGGDALTVALGEAWPTCAPPPPVVPALPRARASVGPLPPSDRAMRAAREAIGGRDLPDWVLAPAAAVIERHLRVACAEAVAAHKTHAPGVAATTPGGSSNP